METIIVTRHAALTQYLIDSGIAPPDARIVPHAGAEEIRGKHVIGVLPLHLAALCERVTVVPLDIPADMRGVELTIEQVRAMARPAETYTVRASKKGLT